MPERATASLLLGLAAAAAPMLAAASGVVTLTDADFDQQVQDGLGEAPWFVEFYAPWCGHCKQLAPHWERLPDLLAGKARVGKVDATKERRVAGEYEIKGFPTLILIAKGSMYSYEGRRDAESMAAWASGEYLKASAERLPKHKGIVDHAVKALKEYMSSAMQVLHFMPSLVFLVFFLGFVSGLVVASCMGASDRTARKEVPAKAVDKPATTKSESKPATGDTTKVDATKED
mmetsp:Transcript_54013/g.150214  ORF Transcript_54013/g.150214 Transcript_54013/m.150214 type:complete len:232 (+) Transcript_54013:97-792(+)